MDRVSRGYAEARVNSDECHLLEMETDDETLAPFMKSANKCDLDMQILTTLPSFSPLRIRFERNSLRNSIRANRRILGRLLIIGLDSARHPWRTPLRDGLMISWIMPIDGLRRLAAAL